jgi:hypothetical protein
VRHAALRATAFGRPPSVETVSQRLAASASKTEGNTTQGLRKLRAQLMAENGASTHQITAWTGHESLAEVARYSRARDRRRTISGTESGNRSGNSEKTSSNIKTLRG